MTEVPAKITQEPQFIWYFTGVTNPASYKSYLNIA
jgi:hypothetical protein